MDFKILAGQVVKSRKYCPNPIVKRGVPAYADAIANPKVVNTLAYHQYWEEQLYFIKNGYQAGGLFIPGRYYYYLNFNPAQTAKGVGPMEIHDYQLDFAMWVDHLKKSGTKVRNGYIPKARRKALSVMTVGMIIDYEWRFSESYHAAVVAGLQEYADDFIDKWRYLDMHMIKEFRIPKLRNNDNEIVAGWQEVSEEGWVDSGTMNTIYIKTVNNDPNVLKGKFLNDIVYEESGENELLLETIAASEDCLKMGSTQYGNAWYYGTGGQMDKGSKGFKAIHLRPNMYNADEHFVPGYVFFEPGYSGAVDKEGNLIEDVPNLLHMKSYERVGWSDFERGKELMQIEKEKLLAEGDMEKYIKFCQNNPTIIEEVFRKSSANNFDQIKINSQLYKIDTEDKKYNKWHLSFKKNPITGEQLIPQQIEIRPATNEDPEYECVHILNDGHPVKGYKNLHVGGADSYDQNQAKFSKSLGAMVVFRRQHDIPGLEHTAYAPVALIRTRPKHKELFYDLCIKLAIYYDLEGSVLIDAAKPLIIRQFIETGNMKYLAVRPKKYDSPHGNQTHDYGVLLTVHSRPQMAGLLQTLFDYHISKIWFEHILNEALDWDQTELDSDNDTVDAIGIAIMQAMSMDYVPVINEDDDRTKVSKMPRWEEDDDGDMINVSVAEYEDEPLDVNEDIVSRMGRRGIGFNNRMSESFSDDD